MLCDLHGTSKDFLVAASSVEGSCPLYLFEMLLDFGESDPRLCLAEEAGKSDVPVSACKCVYSFGGVFGLLQALLWRERLSLCCCYFAHPLHRLWCLPRPLY